MSRTPFADHYEPTGTAGTAWPFAPDDAMWDREEARHDQHRAAVCALTRYARQCLVPSQRRVWAAQVWASLRMEPGDHDAE